MQNDFQNKDNASRWKYIGVWFLASICGKLASHLIALPANVFISSKNYQAIALLITAASSVAVFYIFIAIYKYFTDLNKTRVFPWIWIVAFISALIGFAQLVELIKNAPLLVAFSCASPFFIAAAFHYYFRNDNERFEILLPKTRGNQPYSLTPRIKEILDKEASQTIRDFNTAAKIYPDIRESLNIVGLYSDDVRRNYIETIVREKAFSKSKEIASNEVNKYLESTFGNNDEIIVYAKYLLQKRDYERLTKLIEYIRVIGNDFDLNLIKDNVSSSKLDNRKDLMNSIDFIFWTAQDYGVCFKNGSVVAFTNSGKKYFFDMSDYRLFCQDYSSLSVSEDMIDKNAATDRLTAG